MSKSEKGAACPRPSGRKNIFMTYEEMRREVRQANLVLVGIGEDLGEAPEGLYRSLSGLLEKKD